MHIDWDILVTSSEQMMTGSRQARLEELKRKSEEKPMRTRMAPAPANTVSKGSFDLGF